MKNDELEALFKFLRDAKRQLKKKDYVGLEISLTQALGRAKNLKTQLENPFVE